MKQALAGVTILAANSPACALAVRIATRFAAKLAADLGADVIRIAADDDPLLRIPPMRGDSGRLARYLDSRLRAASGAPKNLDVVLTDDAANDHGAVAPIAVRISMFGPGVAWDGHDSEFTIMALSGLLDTVGDPARAPLKLAGHQVAFAAGLAAYAGMTAALYARATAETVRVSLFDTAVWLNWKNLASAAYFGASPSRPGRDAQWQVVRCRDGYVALIYMEKDWAALKALVADARLSDGRFASDSARTRHAREIGDIVESVFMRHTRREVEDLARSRRLPLGAVWSPVELAGDPQYVARDALEPLVLGDGTIAHVPRLPVRWHDAPGRTE